LLGAAVTSLLFNLGKTLLGLYLARSNPASAFGAAASVVLILIWVYYTAQILFLGAEFTVVYADRYGAGIAPEGHAEKVGELERAQQGIPRRAQTQEAVRSETLPQELNPPPQIYAPAHLKAWAYPQPARRGAGRSLSALTTIMAGLAGISIGLLLGSHTKK
jgi:membrane protein